MKRFALIFLTALAVSCSGGKYHLHEENDYFNWPDKNSDNQYTQGLKLSYGKEDKDELRTYSLGQQFYTPTNKRASDLQKDDRPYAGYLFGEYQIRSPIPEQSEIRKTYQLGVVGPHAYGKETQTWFHNVLGQRVPAGWDNQLDDELAFMYGWEQFDRSLPLFYGPAMFDAVQSKGYRVGNVLTDTHGSVIIRMGKNLPKDFGPRTMTAGEDTSTLRYYLFTGTEVRAIARNIFLDGNTFSDSHSVKKEGIVADIKVGFAFHWKAFRLTYTWILITPEYEKQNGMHSYGTINIGIERE